jgi:hypothetical protein
MRTGIILISQPELAFICVYHTILHVECAFTFYQLLLSRTGSVHKAENDFLKALDADLYVGTGMYLSD